jgi:hypothetical protein
LGTDLLSTNDRKTSFDRPSHQFITVPVS